VLPLPGGKELLVTDGDTATVRFVDQRSGATRATVTVGGKPDAAIWDARRKQAVVMSARGGSVEFIDPATAKVKASVPLAPFLESAAFDREGVLFVNNEKLNVVHVVDVDQARSVGTIALTGCTKPTGMAYVPWRTALWWPAPMAWRPSSIPSSGRWWRPCRSAPPRMR
jgi:DNA-binding beta-propeller fold protein YncE